MPNTARDATRGGMRDRIESLVAQFDASIPSDITRALQSMLTAKDYDDVALIRSALEEAMLAFVNSINEAIQKRLGWPKQARATCREIWDGIRERPRENWDDVGADLESRFDEMLKILSDLREGPVKLLREREYEIENVAQLESDIRELHELKKGIIDNWPWSNRELPPVDVEMLEASMAALAVARLESLLKI